MVQAKVVNYHLFNNERELCFVLYRKGRILALLCLVELVLNLAIAGIKKTRRLSICVRKCPPLPHG